METKRCDSCGFIKPLDMFYARGEQGQKHTKRSTCRQCWTEKHREWRKNNPERDRRNERNAHLLREFGITVDDEDRMIAQRDNRCDICKEQPSGKGKSTRRLHVDHDADTGKLRGLLCSRCNQGIGLLLHDPGRLLAALAYLSRDAELAA